MIFLTVGTLFPFDRLVKTVDELAGQGKIKEEIFAQIGKDSYTPIHFEWVETLAKKEYDTCFRQADSLIAHAGMGTISMALEQHKPILVMPRLKKYRELVSDHQLTTAKRFEQQGHVLAAYQVKELDEKIQALQTFQPVPRENQARQVAEYIGRFLQTLS